MTGLFRNYTWKPGGPIELCDDLSAFVRWYEEEKNRRVAVTAVPYGPGDKQAVIVSTVFLGMDHSLSRKDPILFETLAELPSGSQIKQQYRTEKEAREGHEKVVLEVCERLDDLEFEGLPEGLREVLKGPQPIPPPKLKFQPVKTKAPNPRCPRCYGTGTVTNSFGMKTVCEKCSWER